MEKEKILEKEKKYLMENIGKEKNGKVQDMIKIIK